MVSTEEDEYQFLSADLSETGTSTWELQNQKLQAMYLEKAQREGTEKAADFGEVHKDQQVVKTAPNKEITMRKEIKTESVFPSYTQIDLSTLYLFSSDAPLVLWNELKEFFECTPNVDPEVNEQSRVVYGNFYDTPQNCSFLASVAQMKDSDESVLDLRRLDGDAFLLNDFFKILKNYLAERELVKPGDDDEDDIDFFGDEDDDDIFAFDDEDGEMGLELPSLDPFKTMMEFEYDPDMLHMMVSDFKDTHLEEKNYFMSMLCHNAVREENRKLMLNEQMHGQVKELIENQLKEKNTDFGGSAALMRNTCLFLKNLTCDMEIDDEMVKAVSEAMGEWCPRNDAGCNIGNLQGSRQSMIELAEFFQQLIDGAKYSEGDILDIMSNTLTTEQVKRIGQFASTRSEDSLELFGSFIACN